MCIRDRGKAVQTFAKVPLLVGRLHIAGGNIVQDLSLIHILPVRLSLSKIGEANILCARTRPKLIGGERAK